MLTAKTERRAAAPSWSPARLWASRRALLRAKVRSLPNASSLRIEIAWHAKDMSNARTHGEARGGAGRTCFEELALGLVLVGQQRELNGPDPRLGRPRAAVDTELELESPPVHRESTLVPNRRCRHR